MPISFVCLGIIVLIGTVIIAIVTIKRQRGAIAPSAKLSFNLRPWLRPIWYSVLIVLVIGVVFLATDFHHSRNRKPVTVPDLPRISSPFESSARQQPAGNSRSIVIMAPPAPEWSEPIDRQSMGMPKIGVKKHIDSPRLEFRYKNNDNRTGICSKNNPVHFKDIDGLRFQSTSSEPEPITISW